MSKFVEIKARASRFLRGERIPDDLRAIFMWLRDNHLGLKTVFEIASFCAHPRERDRGLSHKMIGNFADSIVGHARSIQTNGYMGEEGRLLLRKTILFNFDQMAPEEVERKFGIKHGECRRLFERSLDAVVGYEDGEVIYTGSISKLQEALLQEFFVMIVRPAFGSRRLIDEFVEGLARTNLIKPEHKVHASTHEDWLAVFAIGSMHLTQIKVDHDATVTLYAGLAFDRGLKHLGVQANVEVANFPKQASMTAFPSRARYKAWCSSAIILNAATPTISVPLDFANDGKLQPIC